MILYLLLGTVFMVFIDKHGGGDPLTSGVFTGSVLLWPLLFAVCLITFPFIVLSQILEWVRR